MCALSEVLLYLTFFMLIQVLLSDRPEYNDKIHGAYLLAPPVYMTHTYNPRFWFAIFGKDIQWLFHVFGAYEFLPNSSFISWNSKNNWYWCLFLTRPIIITIVM